MPVGIICVTNGLERPAKNRKVMAIIKLKSVKDISKLKEFKVESIIKLYFQENDYIVKIFLDCYRSLDQKIGKDIFNLLVKLRKLEGESQLILPRDIYD